MKKDDLEAIYQAHHERGKRYGYLYCHGERGPYLREWMGTGKKVLDLGCRDGMLTAFFAAENEVLGVDIDRKALQRAEENLPIQTLWLDLNTEWPFLPASFDVIVACEIIEHLFFPEFFLDRVQKTLKPGGVFIGSVPNTFRFRNRWKFLMGKEYENDPTHVRQFSYQRLRALLDARFERVGIFPLRGKVIPFVPVSPKLPLWVRRLFGRDLLWKAYTPSG